MSDLSIRAALIIFHPDKQGARDTADLCKNLLSEAGVATRLLEYSPYPEHEEACSSNLYEACNEVDIVIVLGGDGTLLGVARSIAETQKPMFGINLGSFGFLTSSTREEVQVALTCLLENKTKTVDRYLLAVRVLSHEGELRFKSYALNESLVTLATPGRLVRISVSVDTGTSLVYSADGLIVATPTGSTGHSLSAGGPILEPQLPALIITPVSPHSLFNRPLVVDGERELTLSFTEGTDALQLILDGQVRCSLQSSDRVVLHRSRKTIPMLMLPDRDFIQILRFKFNLGHNQ